MSQYRDKTLIDNDRRLLNLNRSEVERLLPEYFVEDFPNIIQLLEAYYEWLDANGNFTQQIRDLSLNRDTTQVADNLLPYLEDEILLGQAYFGGFLNKREAIKFSNTLYRSKGTKYSIEQFFRGFYGVDPQVIYPKENIFKVGPRIDYSLNDNNSAGEQILEPASVIGPESRKYITDDKLYQVMSVLIRVGVSVKDWLDVYKLFVHPAGVYLGSELLLEMVNTNTLTTIQDEIGDPITEAISSLFTADLVIEAYSQTSLLNYTTLSRNEMQRQRVAQNLDQIADYTFETVELGYDNIYDLLSVNSMTMDDSATLTMSQDSDSGVIYLKSTLDQHRYDTLFDSAGNSADSAHYPFEHI
jgi:hypothetical protein